MAKWGAFAAEHQPRAPQLSASASTYGSGGAAKATQSSKEKALSALSLQELETRAHELATSNPTEALDTFLQVLQAKRQQFGGEDAETRETELDVVEVSNRIAQELAQQGRTGEMGRFVQQSSELTQHALPNLDQNARRLFLRAQMFNGMTCMAKGKGDVRAALKHCEKGLSIMLHLNMLDQLPTCYLNVCALYSTLGLHAEALKHAFLALQILRELIRNIDAQVTVSPKGSGRLPGLSHAPIVEQESYVHDAKPEPLSTWIGFENTLPTMDQTVTHSRLTTLGTQLAITYFNIAVEQEYLLDFPTCIRTYEVAITSAEDFLGPDDPLTRKFKRTLKKALKDEDKLKAAVDQKEQQRKKQMKYKYGVTSVASVHSVYKTNVHPDGPASAPAHDPAMPPIADQRYSGRSALPKHLSR
eukprot:GGOE01019669.1.p1 GENE.GGOE01019669.1~~GGOE01019669.1.p1  ORF type:complete len:416 (+),score=146.23 GGOE01019669.1:78-1325(+)